MGIGSGPVWDGEKWVHPGGDPQPSAPLTETPQSAEPQPSPPAESSGLVDRVRTTISHHPLTSGAVCLAIGLVLAAGITAAITSPQISSASSERDSLSAQLANTQ